MSILVKLGLVLAAIIALVGVRGGQAAYGNPQAPLPFVIVLADRQAVSESEKGVGLVESFLGLVSALKDGHPFAFVNADEPTNFMGPTVAGQLDFKTVTRRFEDSLRPVGPVPEADLISTLAQTYNMLGIEAAAPGSTIYLITGAASGPALTALAERIMPMVGLFQKRGWPIVALSLPGTSQELHEITDTVSLLSGGGRFELSVPDGLRALSGHILGSEAKGSFTELTRGELSPNEVLTSTLSIAPGTREGILLFLKESPRGSLRLSDPSGFAVSSVVETPHAVIWRLNEPTPGQWNVDARGIEGAVSAWHYAANKYGLDLVSHGSVPLNEPSTMVAFVTEARERVALEGVRLTARITAPDGATLLHELNDNGVSGDAVEGDGYFSATIPPVGLEGEYKVELQLSWPEFDHRISSPTAFRAQAFPSIKLTPAKTQRLRPGERSKVANLIVHVEGQPYAIPAGQLQGSLTTNLDRKGTLEIKPQRFLDRERAWAYELFFTPDLEGLHTLVMQLTIEYAGRSYTHIAHSMVLSSSMPALPIQPVLVVPTPVVPPPVAPEAVATLPLAQLPSPEPVVVQPPSGSPWGAVAVVLTVVAVLAAGASYWSTRTRPHGYLYSDRDEMVVDFANLKRHPILRLLFRSYVLGTELGVSGLEGVRFKFTGKRIRLSSRGVMPTIRVNNQPVVGDAWLQDRTWIGTYGRLLSFYLSAPKPQMEPGLGDD